jgi:hypothetical protein
MLRSVVVDALEIHGTGPAMGKAIVHGPSDNRNPRLAVLKLNLLQYLHLARLNLSCSAV